MSSNLLSRKFIGLTFGMCLAAGAPVQAQIIDTSNGDGSTLGIWGTSGNPTFGQTFRAPSSGSSTLRRIEFGLQRTTGGAMSYLAAVYAWSGSTATGSALSQSGVSITPAASVMTRVALTMTGSALTPGIQYVVVLTTVGANASPGSRFFVATAFNGPYADGDFVFSTDTNLVAGATYNIINFVDMDMLLLFSPDPVNTRLALQSNANAVQNVLAQRAATTTFALDYDCSVFDANGFCVSVGFRNTQMGSNYADSGETAGLFTAAYRVTPEFRIGGFIDQNLVAQSPVGVDPKNTQPMLGAFAVYQENPSSVGLTLRAALAYQEGDLRITRPESADTEAGTGRMRTNAFAFGGEIAYGFPLDGTWVAQPYAGLRRSDSQRRGYTETTSADVEFPITYNRFGQTLTSAMAGLRLRGAITPQFSLTFGAGMEHDLDSKLDRYSGTSTISGVETFSLNASQQQNETRAVGSAGMRYMIASNQALAFDASVRQMPYGNDPSITTMLRYSIGF